MHNEKVMVSIAMITYNHEKYLRKAIESILMQNVDFKYEIVIGEDCSPDNSRTILREYEKTFPDRFNVIYRDKNVGATRNIYNVLIKCKGKYIVCLEGDDYWTDPDKLKIQVAFLESNNEYSATSHIVSIVDEDENCQGLMPSSEILKKLNLLDVSDISDINDVKSFIDMAYKSMSHIMHIQSFTFRNFFLKIEKNEKVEKLLTTTRFIDDIQLELLILEKGKIKFLNRNMGCYRRVNKKGNTSFTSQVNEITNKDIILAWELINEYFDYQYNEVITDLLVNLRIPMVTNRIVNKDYKSALTIFTKKLGFIGKIKLINYIFKRVTQKTLISLKLKKA